MAIPQVSNAVNAAMLDPPNKTPPHGAVAASQAVQDTAAGTSAKQPAASSLEQIQKATAQIAKVVQAKASTLEFSIDKETDLTVVKVVDTQTQEVIRQIPAEEIIEIARAIDKLQGLLVRQKA